MSVFNTFMWMVSYFREYSDTIKKAGKSEAAGAVGSKVW